MESGVSLPSSSESAVPAYLARAMASLEESPRLVHDYPGRSSTRPFLPPATDRSPSPAPSYRTTATYSTTETLPRYSSPAPVSSVPSDRPRRTAPNPPQAVPSPPPHPYRRTPPPGHRTISDEPTSPRSQVRPRQSRAANWEAQTQRAATIPARAYGAQNEAPSRARTVNPSHSGRTPRAAEGSEGCSRRESPQAELQPYSGYTLHVQRLNEPILFDFTIFAFT